MRWSYALLGLLMLALAVTAMAQKKPFTIEDLYKVKSISSVHVSPDGKSIVYAVTTSDLPRAKQTTHIWMMNSDGTNIRQMTEGDKSEVSPVFSPDSKWIAFVSNRDGNANLYLLPLTGGEAKKLTDISTGVSDPLWSPDGKSIAFSSDVYPECGADDACNKKIGDRWHDGPLKAHMASELLYRHWTDWKDGTRTHIFLADVASGGIKDMTPGDYDSPTFELAAPLAYDFSPDGKELAYVSNHDKHQETSTNKDIWIVSVDSAKPEARNITVSNPAYDGTPRYSPDGRYIAYRLQKQPSYESDLFRLGLYDRKTGTSEVLTESFRNWVEDFKWASDSKSIFFSADVEGQVPIYNIDIANKQITQTLADKTIDEFDFSPSSDAMIFTRRSTGSPAEIYKARIALAKAANTTQLSHLNADLANQVDIRPAESMWVDGAGGAKVEVFVVKPHDFDPNKKYPLILNVHGGPQDQWTDGFRGDWQIYPGSGYVVAFANPHGSTGYGQDFTAEISGDFGGYVFQDLMKVTDALEKLPYVDSNRMGAMGWSYGGYMMDWFEGHTDRFKAIASMMGIYDLTSFYGATEELWFPEWDLKGTPWTSDDYQKFSPSSYVKDFKTPCMVISGERDYRVPYTQALEFYTALQKMNVPSRLIIYSNSGHWPNWYEMALYYTAHLDWFHKYLGGQPPPWTTEQFLRNDVFDKETGKRIVPEAPEAGSASARTQ